MTWQAQPNLSDVTERSGLMGNEGNFHNHFPNTFVKQTSGNGSISVWNSGVHIEPSGSNGSTASVHGINSPPGLRFEDSDMVRLTTLFNADDGATAGYQDDFTVGGLNLADKGAGLNLTSEQYQVDGTTKPATVPKSDEGITKLVVEIDGITGETRFVQAGIVDETVTINALPFKLWTFPCAFSKSNGEGDELVNLRYHKTELVL